MSREYWFVTTAALLYGTIAAGGQFFINSGLSLFEVSLYRVLLISLILLPVVLVKRQYLIKREAIYFFTVYGLIGAFLELTQFAGIALGVPVAIVVFLLYSQPVWTVPLARLMLDEKITVRKILSVVIALLGLAVLLKSWDIKSFDSMAGVTCALLGGIFLSLWIIWGRKSGMNNQHYLTTTIGWSGFSVVWLLLLWPITALFIQEPSIVEFSLHSLSDHWVNFLIFGFVAGVIPHLLFYRGMKNVQASIAGIILLLEPVSATLLAKITFGQPIGLNVIWGGGLILLSNYLVIRESK
ncbi:MAG TPA: EamA family transporter [Thermodesulfobacteriota bacterium]|nr:EamA family transporter [Thermodesulfobacteriota bacterium]